MLGGLIALLSSGAIMPPHSPGIFTFIIVLQMFVLTRTCGRESINIYKSLDIFCQTCTTEEEIFFLQNYILSIGGKYLCQIGISLYYTKVTQVK